MWTPGEVESVLGDEATEFCETYDVIAGGNFEGKSIVNLTDWLNRATTDQMFECKSRWAEARAKLLEVRNKRIRPGLDDKVIVSWNGLMIAAMARAAAVFENGRWETAAIRAAEFVLEKVRRGDGRLLHTWRNGKPAIDGYLDDYGAMLCGVLELYRLTFDKRWVREATHLADLMCKHFADEAGGFFFTASDAEKLIARRKPWHDNSVPSGNALAACGLWQLGQLTGDEAYIATANHTIESAAHVLNRVPHAASQMLIAMSLSRMGQRQIVIAGDPESSRTLMRRLQKKWLPGTTLILMTDAESTDQEPFKAVLAGKEFDAESVTLFDCENFTCKLPVVGESAINEWIDQLDGVTG